MESEIIRGEFVIDWKKIFGSIIRRWIWLVLALIIGLAAGFGLGATAFRPAYAAEARYVVIYKGGDSISSMYNEYSFISRILYNCQQIIKQNSFATYLSQKVNEGIPVSSPDYITPGEIASGINAEAPSSTQGTLIYVTVSTKDQSRTDRLIKAMTAKPDGEPRDALSSYVFSVYPLAGGDDIQMNLINTPVVALTNSNSQLIFTAIGGVAFLVICFAVLFLIGLLDTKIKKPEDLKNKYNVPLLGIVPDFKTVSGKGAYHYAYYKK